MPLYCNHKSKRASSSPSWLGRAKKMDLCLRDNLGSAGMPATTHTRRKRTIIFPRNTVKKSPFVLDNSLRINEKRFNLHKLSAYHSFLPSQNLSMAGGETTSSLAPQPLTMERLGERDELIIAQSTSQCCRIYCCQPSINWVLSWYSFCTPTLVIRVLRILILFCFLSLWIQRTGCRG